MLTSKNIKQEIEKFVNLSEEISYVFELTLHGNSCNGDPEIYIKINDQNFYQQKIKGTETFKINKILPTGEDCNIIIGLNNKNSQLHTVVKNNKILEDMNVKILDFKVNNISLIKKNLYFFDEVKFIKADDDEILYKVDGLYYNGELILTLPTPIFPFLSKVWLKKMGRETKISTISDDEVTELINKVFD